MGIRNVFKRCKRAKKANYNEKMSPFQTYLLPALSYAIMSSL